MSQFTIYHNPRCSKSRQTLSLLQENGIEPEIVLYLQNPPTKAQLKRLLKALGLEARDLLRSGEQEYKDLGLSDPALSDEQLLDAMVNHPKLIQRPIVSKGEQAVIGRPPENVLTFLS